MSYIYKDIDTQKHVKKKGHNVCRFNFPLAPMPRTMILEPLSLTEKRWKNHTVQKIRRQWKQFEKLLLIPAS